MNTAVGEVNFVEPALEYALDFWQRSLLFTDIMRERGNQYVEHVAKKVPHVLKFNFEPLISGRDLARPTNYGLVRIIPPEGIETDSQKRPFVVVDPRAGHGPGIGGLTASKLTFKQRGRSRVAE